MIAANKERTNARNLQFSALLRRIANPARHLDMDAIQYCARCSTASFVAEWTTSSAPKATTWTRKLAAALNARALLVRSNFGEDPIENVSIRDLPESPVPMSAAEFIFLCEGLLRCHCRCLQFPVPVFLRYPGSKRRLSRLILRHVPVVDALVEPFAGSGAIAAAMLANGWPLRSLWLNDADPGIADLWKQVAGDPSDLLNRVRGWSPNVDDWYRLKSAVPDGWSALALASTSFGGLGRMAGGPIGGREQKSEYPIGCRFNPEKISTSILWWHQRLQSISRVKVTCIDGVDVLLGTSDYAYVDPPYFDHGRELYEQKIDHETLARTLTNRPRWLMSIGAASQLRDLYRANPMTVLCGKKTTLGGHYEECLISPVRGPASFNLVRGEVGHLDTE